jgi:hypothetical protein
MTRKHNHSIVRYRKCRGCGYTFKTLEVRLDDMPTGHEFDLFFSRVIGEAREHEVEKRA